MSWLALLKDQRLWFAAAGLLAGLAWHDYAMRGIELELAAEREKKQQVVIEYREREALANNENVSEYLEALDNARKETDDLRRRLADGSISLRVCRADYAVRAAEASNSAAALEKARADLAAYQEDAVRLDEAGKQTDAWVQSAWEFINR